MNLIDKNASPTVRLEMILSQIGNQQDTQTKIPNNTGDATITINDSYMRFDPNYFGLISKKEMKFYLDTLVKSGWIEYQGTANDTVPDDHYPLTFNKYGKLTFAGLEKVHSIENKGVLSKKCFVAMPFDKKKNKRIEAIRNACSEYGLHAFTVDEHVTDGNHTIDAKIISAIKSSKFCVADFTGINQGAYMEAGYAMGRDIKVIFICEKKDFETNKKHFDVRHYPFLFYSDFADLTAQLKDHINSYILS